MEASNFQFNNYQVRLALNDIQTQLIINTRENTLRRFQLIITPERVQGLTAGRFEDLQFMYAGLQEAFEKTNPSVEVNISDNGVLTYSVEQTIRGIKRTRRFTLILNELALDEAEMQEMLNVQRNKINELETQIAELQQRNNQLQADLERRISQLEIMVGERLIQLTPQTIENYQGSFESACTAGKFSFANDNKTITYLGPSAWSACLANSPLSRQQKTKFCVKADSISSAARVMIGVCPSSLISSQNLWSQSGVYCYYGYLQGYMYINGKETSLNNCGLKSESVLAIIVDLVKNKIIFELDGSRIHKEYLNLSKIRSYDYYLFVELIDKNDKVSFI